MEAFLQQQGKHHMGPRINLTIQPLPEYGLAPETGSVVLWKPRCQALGQHSTAAQRLSCEARRVGKMLLPQLIEGTFFWYEYPSMPIFSAQKAAHL